MAPQAEPVIVENISCHFLCQVSSGSTHRCCRCLDCCSVNLCKNVKYISLGTIFSVEIDFVYDTSVAAAFVLQLALELLFHTGQGVHQVFFVFYLHYKILEALQYRYTYVSRKLI